MADEYRSIERNTTTETKPSSNIAFIVGGLVVAVGVILWLVFGGMSTSTTPTSSTTNTSVTVEPTAPAAPAPAADPAPAPAPAEPTPAPAPAPAPADPVTPPVTGTAPATP
jgi:cytoskeletal protein RodZ